MAENLFSSNFSQSITSHSWKGQPDKSDGSTVIRNLYPGPLPMLLVGLVIAKEDKKTIQIKKEDECGLRGVLTFVLRDSPCDTIAASLWGSPDYVDEMSMSFAIGDIVQINGVNVKEKTSENENFTPWTSSHYQLTLNENSSTLTLYDGHLVHEYMTLAHIIPPSSGSVYLFNDIINNFDNLKHDLISFTAAVRSVGSARRITAKTSGRQLSVCDVKLFDFQVPLLYLVLWSDEFIKLSRHWQPNETVLSITDVRIRYDQYKKGVVASTCSKTVITINPDTKQAASLYHYAQSISWPDDEIDESPIEQSVDVSTVKTKYKVNEFLTDTRNLTPGSTTYGVIFGFLSTFDVDGSIDKVVSGKCCECSGKLISVITGRCPKYDCMTSHIEDLLAGESLYYSVKVDISDHSGSLSNCRVSGNAAKQLLQCKVDEFVQLSDSEKTVLKWRFLFERCKFVIKAHRASEDLPVYHLMDVQKVTCQEYAKYLMR